MQGKDFEDNLCSTLEDWVDGEGYVWLRRQTRKMRRGQFSMGQEVDILVDSSLRKYYICIEAKSRNTESRPGFYFSSDLNIEQIEDGIEYAEKSGREYIVAVELRNYDDHDRSAWIVSPELFIRSYGNDETKVSWSQVDQYGYLIGHDGDYEITRDAIDAVIMNERN